MHTVRQDEILAQGGGGGGGGGGGDLGSGFDTFRLKLR